MAKRERDLEVRGQLTLGGEDTAARTDVAPHNTIHVYTSGTSVFLGVYSNTLASPGWKYQEIT